MTRADLGMVAKVNGRLAECIAIRPAHPIWRYADEKACPHCGRVERFDLPEDCLLYREAVKPVETV